MRGKTTESRGKVRFWLDRGGIVGWQEVSEKEYKKHFPDKSLGQFLTTSTKGWPRASFSAGVDPSQIDEAEAANKKAGDNVTYVREGENAGDAIFESRAQRKKHLKNIKKPSKTEYY
jgi:hypothetical protein